MNVRNFRWEDFPAVVGVMNAYSRALGGTETLSVEQVEPSWRSPYNHPERDCFVALSAEGQVIAFTIADLLDDPHHANGVYFVAPAHLYLAPVLLRAAETHFMHMAASRATADRPLTMRWKVSNKDSGAINMLADEGYQTVRAFYTMRINLDQPIETAPLPEGFALRGFKIDDFDTLYAAKNEAFQDHWGGDEMSYEEWQSDIHRPDFDPTLWWVATCGDEIAGMVLSRPFGTQFATIGIVGVRRGWRKRGLAYALLRQCFAEYQRRGYQQIDLGVDAESSTNAVSLYQRAGMHIHACRNYYDKVLQAAAPHRSKQRCSPRFSIIV